VGGQGKLGLSWTPDRRTGIERRLRRRRNSAEERDRLRRLTVAAAIAAIGLNSVLFLQTAAGSLGSADPTAAIVSLIQAVFPGRGLGAPAGTPSPAPGATPIAVSGGS
jgi:hypothetical protein